MKYKYKKWRLRKYCVVSMGIGILFVLSIPLLPDYLYYSPLWFRILMGSVAGNTVLAWIIASINYKKYLGD